MAARLKAIYGDVDALDAFVGILAAEHVEDSEFGELQAAIWKAQFEALRDGDRFFYENYPALATIRDAYGIDFEHSLAEIIALNTEVEPGDLQENIFLLAPEEPTEPITGEGDAGRTEPGATSSSSPAAVLARRRAALEDSNALPIRR